MNADLAGRRQTRRRFLAALALLGLGGSAYARFVEPNWLDTGRVTVPLSRNGIRQPLRLLHLSDLHASLFVSLEFIAEAIQAGVRLRPDLICVTGDFVTRKFNRLDHYAEILSALPKCAPTFACLGNHDGGRWSAGNGGFATTREVSALLTKSGIELLSDKTRRLRVGDWPIQLVGLGDLWGGAFWPLRAFARAADDPADATIVLAHNPDAKDQIRGRPWDLMLSGHTHGGQLRLPALGTPFAPVKDMRFVAGLYAWEDRWLHITKGVGNVFGLRFNCRQSAC
ncbi:MAG: phosphodiesterase YaeI [Verrucomicrobia bacterium]|nr:phosphodiesterase YaeI [Verrucomicrobiota bacterium]